MESTLSTTSSLLNLTKTLNKSSPNLHRQLTRSILHQCLHKRFVSCNLNNSNLHRSVSNSAVSLRNLYLASPSSASLACITTSSTTCFASSGGGSDGGGGGGSGEIGSKSVAAESDDVSALSPDVIILDVTGMTCGGCAASVKRILESQPNVSSASVNLATETAVVWPVSEAKVMQNWQQQLGETLAKHLTNCGFKSNPRGQGEIEGDIA